MELSNSAPDNEELQMQDYEEVLEPSNNTLNYTDNMLSKSLDRTMRDLLETTITNLNPGSIVNTLINSKNMLTQSLRHPDQTNFYIQDAQYPHRTVQTMISESPQLVIGILLFVAFFFISLAYYVVKFIYICWKYTNVFLMAYLHTSVLSTFNGLYFILLNTYFAFPKNASSKITQLKQYLFQPYKINSEAIQDVQFDSIFYKILYCIFCVLNTAVMNTKIQCQIIKLCLQLGSIQQKGKTAQFIQTLVPITLTMVYFIKQIKNSVVMEYARYAVYVFLLGNNYFTMLYNQLKILFTEQKRCHAQEE